jgi:signal transduction histidine kinase
MRNIFVLLMFLFLVIQPARTQNKIVDNLKILVANTDSDSAKILLMIDLASYYQFYNSDAAIAEIEKAIRLAQKAEYKRGELISLSRKGELQHLRGELPLALETELNTIQLSQKYNYPDIEAQSLTFLGTIYLDLEEYKLAQIYLFLAEKIYQNIDRKLLLGSAKYIPPYTLTNIGTTYEKLNMLDSAMYFYKAAFGYSVYGDDQQNADLRIRIGILELRKKNYPEAIRNFREAVRITEISNDLLNRSVSLYQIGMIFKEFKNLDSAINYAFMAYKVGEKSSYKVAILDASNLLSKLYKQKRNLDSAFYYQQIANDIKDSLFGLEKYHKIQLLALSEQHRLQQLKEEQELNKTHFRQAGLLFFVVVSLIIAFILWRSNRQQKKANYSLNEKNVEIKRQSEHLEKAFADLKSTQSQLIQSEKMASLGELTAGIAHEIQNPLNFVNNFSEVNIELIDELKLELSTGNTQQAIELADNLKENEQKINHHGKRADAIVKGMLQHSRSSSGIKEPTDINKLADEYLRLAYHGLRAKDKSFNATMHTDFDLSIGKIKIIPQDIGRVILNLITNAFYVVDEKTKTGIENYEPTVYISTKKLADKILISVKDNGNGIPQKILDKIFQPFFTTKPTGQGTGLGLSLSYDIVKAHGGEIKVETKEGEGTDFIIQLPS